MAEFKERLKEAMKVRNIAQNELCEKTGIPKSAMSQYVSGAFQPKKSRANSLADALNINVAWLMGFDVPMEKARNNGEQICYDFAGLNQILSDFPTTSKDVIDTLAINKAIDKTMQINNAILSTPRLYCTCTCIDDAIVGLKYLLAYYHINFEECSDDSIANLIDSSLFKDFIKNIFQREVEKDD